MCAKVEVYYEVNKNFKILKGSSHHNKSNETCSLRNYWLPTLQAVLAIICACSCKQFQLGSYIHACTNETHSLDKIWPLLYYRQHKLAKVGIKSC